MTATLLTVEEFLKLPDPPEGHIELHHGEVVVMPPPKLPHQIIQDNLQTLIKNQLAHYVVYMEMAFRPAPEYEVWSADVGCISLDRRNENALSDYIVGAPDIVIEVLSPSNTVEEINEKMSVCMSSRCRSFWVVEPKRKVVSVTEGATTVHYSLQVRSWPGIQLMVEDIFQNA